MNLTPEEKFNQEVWWILQEIKKDALLTPKGKRVEFTIRSLPKTRSIRREDVDYGFPQEETQRKLLYKLKEWKAIKDLEPLDNIFRGSDIFNPRIYGFVIIQSKFNELYRQYEESEKKTGSFNEEVLKTQQLLDKLESDIKKKTKEQEQFEIKVKDRYIWVNDYLLSKPHAVGSNFDFFEYVRSHPANTKIERKNLPSQFGSLSLSEQIKKKSFIKILNELGFKDEILKAFFPKRGKNMVVYRGDKITKKDLEKAGVKIPLFLKELEVAHLKNSPE